MTSATFIALSALELPAIQAGIVPEWIHIVPKGSFTAKDGRGPWAYSDAAGVIQASFAAKPKIHIDTNHSTITAGQRGEDAPAVGYVLEMEERDTGIWARVDWTALGQKLLSDRAYWGVSPVIMFNDKTRNLTRIDHVALTNNPAVTNLTPLSAKEQNAMFTAKVAKMLGLAEDANEDDVLAALSAKIEADGGKADNDKDGQTALAALSAVGSALGIEGDATETILVAAIKGIKASGGEQGEQYAALQAEVTELKSAEKKRAAEAFVDGAIRDKRSGVKVEREGWIALHMSTPETAEKLINGLNKLAPTHTGDQHPARKREGEGIAALSAEERAVAVALGSDPEKYLAQLKADAVQEEAL